MLSPGSAAGGAGETRLHNVWERLIAATRDFDKDGLPKLPRSLQVSYLCRL